MAVKDFIISFFAGSPLLSAHLKQLKRDYVLFEPQVSGRKYKDYVQGAGGTVLSLWNKAMKKGDTLGRVAVIGFSEGCQGVSAVLECSDASAIDVCIPIDGIHRQYVIGQAINPVTLWNYIAFAKLASSSPPSMNPNTKLMVITHSSIGAASLPKGMASTTQTADVIWQECFKNWDPNNPIETALCGICPAKTHQNNLAAITWPSSELPLGTKLPGATITSEGWSTIRPSAVETGFLPSATFSWSGFSDGWRDRRIANNLYIFGWVYDTPNHTKDPTGNRDHVFQAQMVLPYVALEMLVTRWNSNCGGAVGFFGFDGEICNLNDGKGYYEQPQTPLPNPYPFGVALPVLPGTCPLPPPGQVIIGRTNDPCWTGVEQPKQPLSASGFFLSLGVVAGGAWLGYEVLQYLRRKRVF